MSQAEVKEAIIEIVRNTADDQTLQTVLAILQDEDEYPITDEQARSIEEGNRQIEMGLGISHQEAERLWREQLSK